MKINPAPLHLVQIVLSSIICAMSISILGTAAHTLAVFNAQQSTNQWWMPMWPQHFVVNGTKALIGSATATFVLTLIFLVFIGVPKFAASSRPGLRAALALGTIIPSGLTSIITIVYAHMINNDAKYDTIQTWTCKYKNDQPNAQNVGLPSDMGNSSFRGLCRESKFSIWGTVAVVILLTFSSVVTVVTWIADKWSARQTRKEMEMGNTSS